MAAPSIGATPLGGEAFQPYVYAPPEDPSQLTQFQILGNESQLLQVFLAPGASVRAEPGAMCFMSDCIDVQTRLAGGLFGVVSRLFSGEGAWQNTLVNRGAAPAYVAFHPPASAKVVPLDLARLGGAMVCQQDSYLASLGDVAVSAVVTRSLTAGFLGGEGVWLQRLAGQGLAFISAAGTLVQKQLGPGEAVVVDAGCLVAFQPGVDFRARYVGSVRRALFAGEGAFYATLTGPGLVLLQSVRRLGAGGLWKVLLGALAFCIPVIITLALLLVEALEGELGNLVQGAAGGAGAGAAGAGNRGGGRGAGGGGGNNGGGGARRWEF